MVATNDVTGARGYYRYCLPRNELPGDCSASYYNAGIPGRDEEDLPRHRCPRHGAY